MLTISVDPVAFTLGSLTVRWYGIMVALAIITLLVVTLRETKKINISQDTIYSFFLWGIVGGFILSRLFSVIDQLVTHPGEPVDIFGFAGLALYGAIAGAVLGAWLYTRVKKIPFSSLAGLGDALAVAAPLAQAIGRVGCTLNGCCFGKPSPFLSFPGAVVYTPRDTIPPQYWGVPLYPTQIYFILWNLIVFAVVWRFRGKLKPQGSLFFLYLGLYAVGDFALRFLRVNDPFLGRLYEAQVISLAILAVVVPWFIIRLRRFQRTTQHSAEGLPNQSGS